VLRVVAAVERYAATDEFGSERAGFLAWCYDGVMNRGVERAEIAKVIGRDRDLDAIRTLLASSDGAGAIVLEGPPGIGKTTLWRSALEDAERQGYRILACSAASSEVQLSFTALRDLLEAAFDDVRDALPPPQRSALEVALLRAEPEGSAQGAAAVAAALLTALRELARTTRLLVAIDDIQWLDPASALVIQYSARRLLHEPIWLLLTVRTDASAPPPDLLRTLGERTHRIELGPLSLGALQGLLGARVGRTFARPALRRIHEASGGNPFFALELARVLDEDSLVGDVLPFPETLRELVHGRLEELPRSCRAALVNVAALGHAKTSLLASVVPDWDDVCELAADAGVLEVRRDRVSFTHPLLASAVYAAAPEERRRAVHRALAEAVDDPEQRAWHLAHATKQPDEDIAAALESAARRVAARGAPDTAAQLAEHARRLTPGGHSDAEARRRLDAAMYTWAAGDGARSRQLLAELIASLPPCVTRARARQLLVKIVDDISETIDELEDALDDAAGDLAEQASVRNLLARQRLWGGDFGGAIADARIAAELANTASAPAELAVALAREAQARLFAGEPLEYELLARAVAVEEQLGDAIPVGDSPTRLRGWCALCVDDLETALECTGLVDRRAASRAESWRAVVLNTLAEVELRLGATDQALRHVQEAEDIASYWGVTHAEASVLAAAALVRAVAGQVEEARTAGTRALELMRPAGYDVIVRSAERALGFLELSLGNAAAAHAVLGPLIARSGVGHPSALAAAPDDIEALLELGQVDEADAVLAQLAAHVDRAGGVRATAALHRCQALIAAERGNLDAAATHARDAAEEGEGVEPFERGRALLVAGQIHRRARQVRAAREALENASTLFARCGAPLWVARTQAELARIGGRRAAGDELTPSERRVAELVAEGKTNREVAAELFVSVHMVEKTLTHTYRKLGLRSRAELARRFAELRSSGAKE
jgi:DNA-binding CsgD family transcriptional regulator/tetratricopeptide (TPR) repeat protein